MKKRRIPIYGLTVHFTNDPVELASFFKSHGVDEDGDQKMIQRSGGLYSAFEDANDKTWRVMAVFEPSGEYIAHEATHAALEVAEYLEMPVNCANSEPVCYLVQWFYSTMCELYPAKGDK